MVTSQSAATAACQAIDAKVPIQQLDYDTLRLRLVADGQVLQWPPDGITLKTSPKIISARDLPGIALDDEAAEFTGSWTTSNA